MTRPRPRSLAWLILFAAVAGTVILSHELTVSPRLQKKKVQEAVTGFSCPDLMVDGASGSRHGNSRMMRSALRMPASCLSDLQRRIRGDTRFRADRCNLVEQCWRRSDGNRVYTFTFRPTYTSFRFEKN